MAIEIISIEDLYHPYKPELEIYIKKYFIHDGNPLKWSNVPITIFAKDYVQKGKSVLEEIFLNGHCFIQYENERYSDAETVKNGSHKYKAAQRIIDIVDSIKKHGYAKGKYKKDKYLINVTRGFQSPWGNKPMAYTLLSRKHRAAACMALGIKTIKVRVSNA